MRPARLPKESPADDRRQPDQIRPNLSAETRLLSSRPGMRGRTRHDWVRPSDPRMKNHSVRSRPLTSPSLKCHGKPGTSRRRLTFLKVPDS